MFLRKKSRHQKREEPTPPRPADEDSEAPPISAEKIIDFLADLVRIYGDHAFDVGELRAEDTRESCDTWARHLTVGVPPPGRAEPEDAAAQGPNRKRDLPGLRQYVSGHRTEEQKYVTQSLGDFREAVWAFIQGLRRAFTADEAADRQVAYRMRRLESAVQKNAIDEIKNEALESVSMLARVLSERGQRQKAQLAALADHLERLRGELDTVREQAARDPLSQLYNRSSFDLHVERVLDFSSLLGKNAFLLMIDIDHFKWINDNHGHPCGDEVLRRVSDCLRGCFLRRDDFVSRYGGEEFAVVIREGEIDSAQMLAERALEAIRDLEIEHGKETIRITASAGLAQLLRGESPQRWVERADSALYEAKQAGRDRLSVAADATD